MVVKSFIVATQTFPLGDLLILSPVTEVTKHSPVHVAHGAVDGREVVAAEVDLGQGGDGADWQREGA